MPNCQIKSQLLHFKQIKQNFELYYFFSDSEEGIKTQVWIALIANLLFTVIHKQIKESEQFTTIVAIASINLGSYVCFISLLKTKKLNQELISYLMRVDADTTTFE